MKNDPILELRHIKKIYPGVVALNDVSLGFKSGEVHAIVGENGAGKSTFIKIVTGAIQPSSGEMIFEGKTVTHNSPMKSLDLGIAAIYQEFNLFPFLSVAENIFHGRYPQKGSVVNFKEMEKQAREILQDLGIDIDPTTKIKDLSVGYQQIVEIAKAVSQNTKVLIMDEPSAPLTNNEVHHLFDIVKKVKAQGVAVIYISHRLEEIFEICDKLSVFRDGEHVASMNVSETNVDELVRVMVNRDIKEQFPKKTYERGEKVLEVKNLSTDILKDINISAYKGEILGLAGLVGAGRTEIARALFGADPIISGEFILNNKQLKIRSCRDAIKQGIGLIPEDRKKEGVLLGMNIHENTTFANMKKISKYGVIKRKRDAVVTLEYVEKIKIKVSSLKQLVGQLSGGNQQKVVLAKWLFTNCEVLIFDEPTRGIDVGAKQEIYHLMHQLVEQGKVIIMITSEMPELLGMADRIVVMHEGEITGMLMSDEATQEKVLQLSSGL